MITYVPEQKRETNLIYMRTVCCLLAVADVVLVALLMVK